MKEERSRIHNKVAELFDLDSTGQKTPKGWYLSQKECPFCGKDSKHFGVKFNIDRNQYRNHLVFNCLRCQEHGSEFKLFKQMEMLHFLEDGDFIKVNEKIELDNKVAEYIKKKHSKESGIDIDVITRHPPLGYRRVFEDEYLDSRGFEEWQYQTYNVGRTSLMKKLKDYIVILVEEGGENKGYLARHKWSKKKIKEYEERTGMKVLRYANEGGIDFGKLLLGIDEVTLNTDTAILVEGAFDKFNVDKQLEINTQERIKCFCTFGKKLSEAQIEKLKSRGIKRIFLLYDNDAVEESKKYASILKKNFSKVRVCFISADDDRDAGDFDREELIDKLMTAQDPVNFHMSKLQKRKLIK